MELAIAIFIGLWMTVSVVLAYLGLKKDCRDILNTEQGERG